MISTPWRSVICALLVVACGDAADPPSPAASGGGAGGSAAFQCPLETDDAPHVVSLAAYNELMFALLSNGRALCWGEDTYFTCGNYSYMSTPGYVQGPSCLKAIAVGAPMAAGITWDDRVMVWGPELQNAAGDGPAPGPAFGKPQIVELPRDRRFAAVSASVPMGALADSGELWIWGDVFLYGSVKEVVEVPLEWPWLYPSPAPLRMVSERSRCFLTIAGEVYCYGGNRLLGIEGKGGQLEPKQIELEGATWLTEGESGHACAVLQAGDVWCWGNNTFGAVGIPQQEADLVLAPIKVEGIPPMDKVYGGLGATCALTSDGRAWCWGDPWVVGPSAIPPVAWHPDLRFATIAVGQESVCGVVADGRVLCTGLVQGCGFESGLGDCFVPIEETIATIEPWPDFDYASWP
jgi:hypothetical protein